MSNILQNKMAQIIGDAQRTTKFQLIMELPNSLKIKGIDGDYIDTICKEANAPGRELGSIDFKYAGMTIPVPAQEKYSQDLKLSFYLEDSWKFRLLIENWFNLTQYDTYKVTNYKPQDIITTITLVPLNFDGDKENSVITFYNCFPKSSAEIAFNSTTVGDLIEYDVNFYYSHYDIRRDFQAMNSDEVANKIISEIQGFTNKVVNAGKDLVVDGISKVLQPLGDSITNALKRVGGRGCFDSGIKGFIRD